MADVYAAIASAEPGLMPLVNFPPPAVSPNQRCRTLYFRGVPPT